MRNPTKNLRDYLAIGNVELPEDPFGIGDAEEGYDDTNKTAEKALEKSEEASTPHSEQDPFNLNGEGQEQQVQSAQNQEQNAGGQSIPLQNQGGQMAPQNTQNVSSQIPQAVDPNTLQQAQMGVQNQVQPQGGVQQVQAVPQQVQQVPVQQSVPGIAPQTVVSNQVAMPQMANNQMPVQQNQNMVSQVGMPNNTSESVQ